MFTISDYSLQQAKKIGVELKPSTYKNKKIDVYKQNKRVASIGAVGYSDYPTYVSTRGKAYADKRRSLYKVRHEKDRHTKGTAGYYADKLLW